MIAFIFYTVLLLGLLVFSPSSPSAQTHASAEPSADKPRQLNIGVKPWTGDFDKMVTRRMIRVLVPYSRTLYFNDKGRERGLTAEIIRRCRALHKSSSTRPPQAAHHGIHDSHHPGQADLRSGKRGWVTSLPAT